MLDNCWTKNIEETFTSELLSGADGVELNSLMLEISVTSSPAVNGGGTCLLETPLKERCGQRFKILGALCVTEVFGWVGGVLATGAKSLSSDSDATEVVVLGVEKSWFLSLKIRKTSSRTSSFKSIFLISEAYKNKDN